MIDDICVRIDIASDWGFSLPDQLSGTFMLLGDGIVVNTRPRYGCPQYGRPRQVILSFGRLSGKVRAESRSLYLAAFDLSSLAESLYVEHPMSRQPSCSNPSPGRG